MNAIRKEDLRLLAYVEFGQLLEVLTTTVRAACRDQDVRIEVVVPILRSGALPGCHLASKLRLVNIFPLQYKHTYDRTRPIQRFPVPPVPNLPGDGGVLIVDTNAVTGEI